MAQGIVSVESKKTITYDGRNVGLSQEALTKDVTNWTRDEIILEMRRTAGEETAAQIKLGNPPDLVISDGIRGKPATSAIRTIEVSFGLRLPLAALSALKDVLAKAIGRTTTRRTGTLSNMGNWTYAFIRDGHEIKMPTPSNGFIPMTAKDAIVLRPTKVPWSTVANIRVSQGRTKARDAKRAAKGQAAGRKGASGFLGQATQQARSLPLFSGFKVAVRFTAHTVAEERWARGRTGTILIAPNLGRRGRRR